MAALPVAAMAAMAVATIASTTATMASAVQQKKTAGVQAKMAGEQAVLERSAAIQEAQDRRDDADRVQSRAMALAAAGGGATDDAGMTNLLSNIETAGEVGAGREMYAGELRAADLLTQASWARQRGQAAIPAGIMTSVGTVAKSIASSYGSGLFGRANPAGAPRAYPGPLGSPTHGGPR